MSFKRNQLEGALRALFSGPASSTAHRVGRLVPVDFRMRLKRLLEIDRAWGHKYPDQVEKPSLAFYDELPVGKGHDASYSAQRAFNLAIGVQLVDFGFKPGMVVEQIALLHTQLERAYTQALAGHLGKLTSSGPDASGIDTNVFLIVRRMEVPSKIAATSSGTLKAGVEEMDPAICWGWDALRERLQGHIDLVTSGVFLIELSRLAIQVDALLGQQPAAYRGRPSARRVKDPA